MNKADTDRPERLLGSAPPQRLARGVKHAMVCAIGWGDE
jgi:hypothetical protein